MPTTYATNLPFPANDDHTFVELDAPSPYFPSHFTPPKSSRYFANYDGKVYCPEEYVEALLGEGCKLPKGNTLTAFEPKVATPAPAAAKALPTYAPLVAPAS
jgi:hypothetical protein